MPDPQPHQDTDDPTSLQRLGATAQMTSKSTMSEKLALATKITHRTGLFTDPRGRDEESLADMAPECAAVTLDSIALETSHDFIIGYPHDVVMISQADVNSGDPAAFCRVQCVDCWFQEEHDYEEVRVNYPTAFARIAWKGKDVVIFSQFVGPGEENVDTFVDGQFVVKGTFKRLRPDDTITFSKRSAEHPFCRLDVGRIAYGGLQPTNRNKDFEEKELSLLYLLGAQQSRDAQQSLDAQKSLDTPKSLDARRSLDMPMAIIIAVAMVVLSGLVMFFFQATPSNAVD